METRAGGALGWVGTTGRPRMPQATRAACRTWPRLRPPAATTTHLRVERGERGVVPGGDAALQDARDRARVQPGGAGRTAGGELERGVTWLGSVAFSAVPRANQPGLHASTPPAAEVRGGRAGHRPAWRSACKQRSLHVGVAQLRHVVKDLRRRPSEGKLSEGPAGRGTHRRDGTCTQVWVGRGGQPGWQPTTTSHVQWRAPCHIWRW